MRTVRTLAALLVGLSVASCGSAPTVVPSSGSIVPDVTFQVTPTYAATLNQALVAAAAGALLYVIYDPLAPNWKIEERMLNANTYYLSLQAKSFRTGGDGEAMAVLKRRALQLQRENGYTSYRILDYSEGIESSTPFTHRVSEGTIQLVRAELLPKSP